MQKGEGGREGGNEGGLASFPGSLGTREPEHEAMEGPAKEVPPVPPQSSYLVIQLLAVG